MNNNIPVAKVVENPTKEQQESVPVAKVVKKVDLVETGNYIHGLKEYKLHFTEYPFQ